MEENRNISEIDAFAKKFIKEIPQEKPSVDFTASIMKSIHEESKESVFTTKALISKKGWFLILGILITVLFIPIKGSEKSLIPMSKINFSFLDKFQMPNIFDSFSVSNTTQYAVFFCALMLIAQVIFLKGYFEKRLS